MFFGTWYHIFDFMCVYYWIYIQGLSKLQRNILKVDSRVNYVEKNSVNISTKMLHQWKGLKDVFQCHILVFTCLSNTQKVLSSLTMILYLFLSWVSFAKSGIFISILRYAAARASERSITSENTLSYHFDISNIVIPPKKIPTPWLSSGFDELDKLNWCRDPLDSDWTANFIFPN